MKRNIFHCCVLLLLPTLIGCEKQSKAQRAIHEDSTWAILPFIKVDSVNPILSSGKGKFICPILKTEVEWEQKDVYNPAAIVRNDSVFLFYRAENLVGKHKKTSRVGLAVSTDGLHFNRREKPILFPDNDSLKVYEWQGGIEDPRIVRDSAQTFFMTYTAYDGKTARLCVASSKDLLHWSKHGLAWHGKYKSLWSKSGAIVAMQKNDQVVAQKINGKYWMYFGDTDIFIATSDDLIHWQPVEENGKLKSVLNPRKKYFDSRLVESGPYALLRPQGILLLYNGMNLGAGGDPKISAGAYCSGQALFEANNPTQLITRLEKNFLMPDKPYEIAGQVNQVCFIEGMVFFKKKWFLYYGTADSKIGVGIH